MEVEVLLGLLVFSGVLIAGLLGCIAALLRRNGRIIQNPHDAAGTRMGEISAQFWLEEFREVHQKLDRIVTSSAAIEILLRERLR